MTTGGEVRIKIDCLKSTTISLKISLGWPVTKLGGQDKLLCKESMKTITLQNVNLT